MNARRTQLFNITILKCSKAKIEIMLKMQISLRCTESLKLDDIEIFDLTL